MLADLLPGLQFPSGIQLLYVGRFCPDLCRHRDQHPALTFHLSHASCTSFNSLTLVPKGKEKITPF